VERGGIEVSDLWHQEVSKEKELWFSRGREGQSHILAVVRASRVEDCSGAS